MQKLTDKIEIRPFHTDDSADLMAIEHTIWTMENSPIIPHYQSADDYQKKIAGKTVFVATVCEKIVGFIDITHPTALPAHQKQWHLGIGVKKEAQSFGVGSALLTFVKQLAAQQQIHKLSLRVLATNESAIRFYQRNDFVEEGHFIDEFYINGVFCDDYQFAYFID